jgi:hypothetical protein
VRSPPAPPVTLACRAQPSARVRIQQTGDEAILLDLASETYFGLNAVGTRLWRLLDQDSSVQNAATILGDEFEVDAPTLERDLLALLEQLADAGLVTIA